METTAGIALAGLAGAAVLKRLRTGRAPDRLDGGRTPSGAVETVLGGLGQGVGALTGSSVRAGAGLAGVAVRTVGNIGGRTLEVGIPAASATAGWLVDGVFGLAVGTGRTAFDVVGGASSTVARAASHRDSGDGASEAHVVVGVDEDTGDTVAVVTEPAADGYEVMVIAAERGTRFHRPECRVAPAAGVERPRPDVIDAGLTACGICQP
jgi:hypothetical protein